MDGRQRHAVQVGIVEAGVAAVQAKRGVVWLRDYKGEGGKTSKICTTTMGAAVDLENEGLRRLLVNAAYWAAGLEEKISAKADVDYVGEYKPGWFGFGKFKPGLKPEDLALPQ